MAELLLSWRLLPSTDEEDGCMSFGNHAFVLSTGHGTSRWLGNYFEDLLESRVAEIACRDLAAPSSELLHIASSMAKRLPIEVEKFQVAAEEFVESHRRNG
ncbi:hypothetical protein ACF3M1_16850 [Luteimonas sp. WGS1318]|uniref:hypothetical protein n=1 Tax=Luteimonas sp. WGS1318 TaxID=3366815 RepID=UPI00372CF04D